MSAPAKAKARTSMMLLSGMRGMRRVGSMPRRQCFRQLEQSGLMEGLVLTESPVGGEYSFTKLGETLAVLFTGLNQWASEHFAAVWGRPEVLRC